METGELFDYWVLFSGVQGGALGASLLLVYPPLLLSVAAVLELRVHQTIKACTAFVPHDHNTPVNVPIFTAGAISSEQPKQTRTKNLAGYSAVLIAVAVQTQ